MRLDQFPGAAQIAIFQSCFGTVHVGEVQILLRASTFAIEEESRDRRTNRNGQQEQKRRHAETSDCGFAPAPAPSPFCHCAWPRLDWFVAKETAKFVGQFLSALVA